MPEPQTTIQVETAAFHGHDMIERVEWKDPDVRLSEAQAFLLAGYQLIREFEGQKSADTAVQALMAAASLSWRKPSA